LAKDLTKGRIGSQLTRLAMPVMGVFFLNNLYSIVDVAMLGRISSQALAGVAVCLSIITIFTTFARSFQKGLVHFLSHALGAKNFQAANEWFHRLLLLLVLLGISIALGLEFFGSFLIEFLTHDPQIQQAAQDYLVWGKFNPWIVMVNFGIFSVLRSDGDTKTALFFTLFGNALNIFLDFVLIFGMFGFPRLEVYGASLATIISRSLVQLGLIVLMVRGRGNFQLRFNQFYHFFRWAPLVRFWKLVFPSTLESLVRGFNHVFIVKIISPFGAEGLAAYLVCHRIVNFFSAIGNGLAQGASAIYGQTLGAGNPLRAWRVYWTAQGYNLGVMIIAGGFIAVFPGPVLRLFISDFSMVDLITPLLQILMISLCFAGGITISFNTMITAGGGSWPAAIAFVGNYGIQLPAAWYLSKHTGLALSGVFWADVLTHIFQMPLFWGVMFWKFRAPKGSLF